MADKPTEIQEALKNAFAKLADLKKKKEQMVTLQGEVTALETELTGLGVDASFFGGKAAKSSSSSASLPKPTEADLPKVTAFLGNETKQLKDVAAHINAHPLALRKLLKGSKHFKLTTTDGKGFVAAKK